ncbi:rab-GTPase-TBC domain-containing protein [Xylariaceae sp. FL0594]|nr:rab-GTPase-TBC domain-containing protein [Xylariaceae sp. FL0594]
MATDPDEKCQDADGAASQPDTHPGIKDATDSKRAHILDACGRKDIDELRTIAITSGGFLTDDLRSKAWPLLLGFDTVDYVTTTPWHDLPTHRDEEQVGLDVDRSFVYYPNEDSQAELQKKKAELSDLITEVLRRHPYLCYFQGYHDVCQVLLLVLPRDLRVRAVSRLSVLRMRDFMLPTLAPSLTLLRLIPDLLQAEDPELYQHLSRNEPYFALSDTLTMFAHNVQRYSEIARLFDALMAREQVFSLYLVTQIVLRRRAELLEHDEADMLHFTLSKLPPDLDVEAVIADAAALFERHPPESLPTWRSISSASVVKTTRDFNALTAQTLRDGQTFFERQVRELRWAKQRRKMMQLAWQNRRLIFAVLVGVGAVYIRKTPPVVGLMSWVTTRLSRSL